MPASRRKFLRTTGAVCGAAALPTWVLEAEAAQAEKFSVDKERLADLAITRAKRLGATYADIRINRYRNESIFTREQQVQNVSRTQSFGFGVRVLVKGAWGFAASHAVNADTVRRVTDQAVAVARANAAYQRKPIRIVPAAATIAQWKGAFAKDPFTIAIDDKIQFLLKLNAAAMAVSGVNFVNSGVTFQNEQKFYASTDGSR